MKHSLALAFDEEYVTIWIPRKLVRSHFREMFEAFLEGLKEYMREGSPQNRGRDLDGRGCG